MRSIYSASASATARQVIPVQMAARHERWISRNAMLEGYAMSSPCSRVLALMVWSLEGWVVTLRVETWAGNGPAGAGGADALRQAPACVVVDRPGARHRRC